MRRMQAVPVIALAMSASAMTTACGGGGDGSSSGGMAQAHKMVRFTKS